MKFIKNLVAKCKNYGKQFVGAFVATVTAATAGVVAHASETTLVTSADWKSVIDALTNQISVSTIVAVLASAVGVAVGFVFLWWGLRKVIRIIMSAVRGGTVDV